jgi:hypothetical protein
MLYPVLTATMVNYGEFTGIEFVRMVILSLLFVTGLFLILKILVRDRLRAGYLTSVIILVLFFINYQTVFPEKYKIYNYHISSFWIIALMWILIFTLMNSRLIWGRIRPSIFNQFLNLTGALLLLLPISQISINFINQLRTSPEVVQTQELSEITLPTIPDQLPDIYYIILDGYARQDILKEIYGVNNFSFLHFLDGLGFYIANESTSNYMQTALSLASSLNLRYLDELKFDQKTLDRKPLKSLIQDSQVGKILRRAGYEIILVASSYQFTEDFDADIILSQTYSPFSPIESMLIQISGLDVIADAAGLSLNLLGFDTHRENILFQFEQLQQIPRLPADKAKFIFAHIIMPHPPFVFDRLGQPTEIRGAYTLFEGTSFRRTSEDYISGYRDQLLFTNQKIVEAVSEILNQSSQPPIIIIQADHGPGAYFDYGSVENTYIRERASILNAYYLPEAFQGDLYPTITPVNTFRIIFNNLFDLQLGLLNDKNYYSAWSYPYKFIDVTHRNQVHCP